MTESQAAIDFEKTPHHEFPCEEGHDNPAYKKNYELFDRILQDVFDNVIPLVFNDETSTLKWKFSCEEDGLRAEYCSYPGSTFRTCRGVKTITTENSIADIFRFVSYGALEYLKEANPDELYHPVLHKVEGHNHRYVVHVGFDTRSILVTNRDFIFLCMLFGLIASSTNGFWGTNR